MEPWEEQGRHVLEELKRLNAWVASIDTKVDTISVKMAGREGRDKAIMGVVGGASAFIGAIGAVWAL